MERESELVDTLEGGGKAVSFIGMICFEKAVNSVGEHRGVSSLSEKPDFGGGERVGCINNEPVEISW